MIQKILAHFGYVPEIRLRVSEAYTQKVAADLREVVLSPHSIRAMEITTQVRFDHECEKVGFFGAYPTQQKFANEE